MLTPILRLQCTFKHHKQCLNCINDIDTNVEYPVKKTVLHMLTQGNMLLHFQNVTIYDTGSTVHKNNIIKGTHFSCNYVLS